MTIETLRSRPPEFGTVVARGFGQFAMLNDDEYTFLTSQAVNVQRHPARTELIEEGSEGSSPLFLLSGWACRAKSLADGRRQILEFLLPGDLIGLSLQQGERHLASSYALTPVVVATATRFYTELFGTSALPHAMEIRRALGRAQETRLINQIVRAGRQTAYERLAHLLLEFHDRLNRVGLANNYFFAMPLTQEILADGLGLSVVHVNRTLQQLRRDKLIIASEGSITLLEPGKLAQVANFRAA
jgi:CRP-like cAMP-binding protein